MDKPTKLAVVITDNLGYFIDFKIINSEYLGEFIKNNNTNSYPSGSINYHTYPIPEKEGKQYATL